MAEEIKNPLEEKIAELENKIALLEQELETSKNDRLRALADLQNFQRREAEIRKTWGNIAIASFLGELLPILTEINLSLSHTKDEHAIKTIEKFFSSLEKLGLSQINPKKEDALNPEFHEVVATSEGEPGKIVECFEVGWKYNDQVLKPAKVSAVPS